MAELLVLGSGGPFAQARRASSAFVVSSSSGVRLLVDAGGGAFERMGRSGIEASQLDPMLLTHLHIDHSGGLAPVVFSAFMEGRTSALTLLGPAARDGQPGVAQLAERLFGKQGAWSYLHSFEGFGVKPRELVSDPSSPLVEDALRLDGVSIRSVAVPHGMMPSVAYRIDLDGTSIVFSGDVQAAHEPLVKMASGCGVLVHDFALPEREVEHGDLHAKPSEVGRVAAACGCGMLLLTHVMPELEDEIDEALEQVRLAYQGPLVVAEDMMRIAFQRAPQR